ncbi:hypothetical protein Tco_0216726 [Tanacetum coccineum]
MQQDGCGLVTSHFRRPLMDQLTSAKVGRSGPLVWQGSAVIVSCRRESPSADVTCITDIKSVLTLKALEIFCETFHIPDEVHPKLPSPNQTIHEIPTAAKVSHFKIMCHVYGFKPMVDAFACPVFFLWHTAKSVSRDPVLKSSKFNSEHYAILIAYLAPFHKYPEPFLCLIGMSHHYTLDENTYPEFMHENDEEIDLFSFIRIADPTKVWIGERQHVEDEPKLLDTTVGHVVPLLPITYARAESELEASVDKLFDEGGSGNQVEQGDSASGGGGPSVNIQPVTKTTDTVTETVIPLQPRHPQKRKTIATDVGGPSYPPKKLREDHGTQSRASVGGKSRFVISSDSSHHSGANVAKAEVDYFARPSISLMTMATIVTSTVDPTTTVKEKLVESSIFSGGSSSAGEADHTIGGFSDLTSSDFIVGGIRTVISPDTDLQKVTTNFSLSSIWGAAHQMSLSAEVRMRAEYNIRERRRLKSVVEERDSLLKSRDEEIRNLKAQLLLKKVEDAEAIRLHAEASKFEAVEKSLQNKVKTLKDHNVVLEKEKSELDVKVADLAASVKVREQEVADLDAHVISVHELETSFARIQEKVTAYENCIDQLEKFQDDRMKEMND